MFTVESLQNQRFTPAHVTETYDQFKQTGHLESVVPFVTGVELDFDAVRALSRGEDDFGDLMRVQGMRFLPGGVVDIMPLLPTPGRKSKYKPEEVTARYDRVARVMAQIVSPIDAHFREWAGVSDNATTHAEPVTLMGGQHRGTTFDNSQHFDDEVDGPAISYKFYLGDPDFATPYYPGEYHMMGGVRKAVAGFMSNPEREVPQPVGGKRSQPSSLLPTGVVTVEPFNASHSGTRSHHAYGAHRILGVVSYPLRKNIG